MRRACARVSVSLLFIPIFLASVGLAQVARSVATKAFPSVVLLVMQDQHHQPVALGSGFFVRPGIIATNVHVIRGAATGYAKLIGRETKLEIVGVVGLDSAHDLALLSIAGGAAPPLSVGDSGSMHVGDEVYAVGNPEGLEGTFSDGIVSGIRKIGGERLLQITAPISPGSSGGPVLNANGKVVGVAVATFRGGQNLNFAIPSAYLSTLIASPKAPIPLRQASAIGRRVSVFSQLGGSNTEGVVGGEVVWTYGFGLSGDYSFSLRNELGETVKNVYCIVVFYDSSGHPIDFDVVHYSGIIPPGLAARVTSSVDSSIQKLTTAFKSSTPSTKVKFRILDFQIVK